MGRRGPAPKRKSELLGHRAKAELDGAEVISIPAHTDTSKRVPSVAAGINLTAPSDWEPSVVSLWNAMRRSSQATLYQEADWHFAYFTLGQLSFYVNPDTKRNAQTLSALLASLGDLLVTEGDRRRVGVEVERREVPVKPPRGNPDWTPETKRFWKAIKAGDQAVYYEPSDWAYAKVILDEVDMFRGMIVSGVMLTAFSTAFTALLITEGARRRVNIELERVQAITGPTPGEKEAARWQALLSNAS